MFQHQLKESVEENFYVCVPDKTLNIFIIV